MSRNTLDIAAVHILREISHLRIILIPSHATALRKIIPPMAYAAIAFKADGLIVEVHTDSVKSLSDTQQSINPQAFSEMMNCLHMIGNVVNMPLSRCVGEAERL